MEENKEINEAVSPVVKPLRSVRAYGVRKTDFEHVGGVSATVPDESMSLSEIVERFTKGQPVTGKMMEGQYHDGDLDSPDLSKVPMMDLVDKQEFLEQQREHAQALKDKAEAEQKAKDERAKQLADEEEELRKEYRERKKKKESESGKEAKDEAERK